MTDEETRLMDEHGITCETKTVYHFRTHKYDRLQDALNYAKIVGRHSKPFEDETTK
ncbi:MAG: hypothetical protein GKR90_26075 [Pseudomonadales bacterium]|nr:hypothetical protein [Pseudomonadales bacterium]